MFEKSLGTILGIPALVKELCDLKTNMDIATVKLLSSIVPSSLIRKIEGGSCWQSIAAGSAQYRPSGIHDEYQDNRSRCKRV